MDEPAASGQTSALAVTILGAGTQGRRLAHMWSTQGRPVYLIDANATQLDASLKAVEGFRQEYPSRAGQIITGLPVTLEASLKRSWLVVECVPEKLELKREIVQKLDSVAPLNVIVASNSSSYTCGEILEGLSLRSASRFLSAHSYWPPETPAIEIMGHAATASVHIDMMLEECTTHGFSPYHVKTPSTGYLYNRIWAAIKREALLVASEGAGTPSEIDAIFRDVLKTQKGPFQLMDTVGLDVVYDIEEHYATARGNLPTEPRKYIQTYLDRGELGVKSGKGFYSYE